MTINYDPQTDILYIRFKEANIIESDELAPLMIADYDLNGNIVGLEVLEVSKRSEQSPEMLAQNLKLLFS